jgi:hypothetical protein
MLLAVGGATPAAGAATCNYTDVVFYAANETTGRLAGELKKFPSSCADYWVSITPRTGPGVNGYPRGDMPGAMPLTAIHDAGANFHAMAEIRLNPWATYASANGWYAAGIEVRRLMALAGYDPARGDTWALNEVGAPTTQLMGADVLSNVGSARQNVRDFIRGLYTGDGTAMPGLVFAADPIHVSTDLVQYRQELESWYADSAFWEDIGQYVRFWAQEGYADVRAWGVPGSTLAERTAYLNDYYLHGLRVAARGGAATEAARVFFEKAYTPVGNAAYRFTPPAGIGFGSTDVDLATMLNFVSTQTYALRSASGDRFGFADQRRTLPLPATPLADVIAVEDRLAAAIKDSETDPSGACGVSGEWCDSAVEGATFTGLWRELGTPTPPTIVPHVEGPLGDDGWYTGDVTVTWTVADPESPVSSTSGCDAQVIDYDTAGATFTCTATSFGGTATPVDVTVKRDATPPDVTCEATPSTLWPPDHRLVPVLVDIEIADATSGPGGFALTEVSTTKDAAAGDVVGFELRAPDVEGLLRAERPGTGERNYRLAYVGHDAAGNADECVATVVVPHDQRD